VLAGFKPSKNNPDNRKQVKQKFVTSSECETCRQCSKGIAYLQKFAIKKQGNGVMCSK